MGGTVTVVTAVGAVVLDASGWAPSRLAMITAITTAIATRTTARTTSATNQPRGDFPAGGVLGGTGKFGAWFGQ